MKAAVWEGPKEIRVEDVPDPVVGPRDVLLKVKAVGICGSDLHVYRHGQYNAQPGRIMGHEFTGEAVDLGSDVEGVTLGDRYTGFSIEYCGECYWCLAGKPRLCSNLFEKYTGYGRPGAMAEYVVIHDAVPGENLLHIPAALDDEVGAMAEPLGTAIYSLLRVKPQDGDKVVVIGAGMIGNLIIQALKARHDVEVIVTEMSQERRRLATECGADVVLDAARPDLFEAIREVTGPGEYYFGESGMADIVLDAAAAPTTFDQALNFVRTRGTVGLVGSPEKPAPVDIGLIGYKDIRVVGIVGSVIPLGLDLLEAGKIATDPLISHRFPLSEATEAFAVADTPTSMKVMLLP
jgi:threonine dehydrogenase-like Zn-dependent dehydrogenase